MMVRSSWRRRSPRRVLLSACSWRGWLLAFLFVAATNPASGQVVSLPEDVGPLTVRDDLASLMVEQADRFLLRRLAESVSARESHFQRDFVSADAYWNSLAPNRERLAEVLGLKADPRRPCDALQLDASTERSSLAATMPGVEIHRVRWPAVGGVESEGLLLRPQGRPAALVLALPDADQTPEQICGLAPGLPETAQFARRLAAHGCLVVAPALISRDVGAYESARPHDLTNREFLYRSAYELGRHLIGYELHKALNAVDWLERQRAEGEPLKLGVFGYGEGGMLALYLAALDRRIDATVVSGYFADRNQIWRQPIDRNVFGLLEQFGDAELAAMIAPRKLIVDAAEHPRFEYPPGKRGAPAEISTPPLEEVRREVRRGRELLTSWDAATGWLELVEPPAAPDADAGDACRRFLAALAAPQEAEPARQVLTVVQPPTEEDLRHRMLRLASQIDRHNQEVLRESPYTRREFMKDLDASSPAALEQSAARYREIFRRDVIGAYDLPLAPPNPRARRLQSSERVDYYEVVLDVFAPDIFAYGILCVPKDLAPGERRAVVVCQHGLEGRPQDVIGEQGFAAYQAFATRLAEQGWITFAPQNPYIFRDRFRTLQRKSYPLRKTLFSLINSQHQQIVDWLQSLPFVDPDRVAFYGLSYGGKTAMRTPAVVTDYCLSICSADFNDWVDKNASTRNPRSYMWTGEYEIFEWNLGSTFNYAEMAALIAPRPFMVERGHFDGVADDWTVAWEFAKVRHLYQAQLKLQDRCEIEWFDGPHQIHGVGTFEFLRRHLGR